MKVIPFVLFIFSVLTFSSCESDLIENNESGKDVIIENSKISTRISRVVYDSYNRNHYIYVSSEIVNPKPNEVMYIAYCADTEPNPTVTDITTSFSPEREDDNTSHRIPDNDSKTKLKSGTTYYIRPFSEENDKITYYKSVSVETIGNDIKLSGAIKDDHSTGYVDYEIKSDATYKVAAYFGESPKGNYTIDCGYIEGGKGRINFNVGNILWEKYFACEVSFRNMNTGISYCYKFILGYRA